jgi:DNA polymerase III alpha subunit
MGTTAKLAAEAARLGQPALGLTDHGVMHGAVEFFRSCKKVNIKPIIGVEAYMTPHGQSKDPAKKHTKRHHLLLLAQNMTGYRNLLKLCTIAQLEGYYYKPRITTDDLAQYNEGLIVTTGCLAAEVPSLLSSDKGQIPQPEKALERFRWYVDVFGPERFYVELQEHNIPALSQINKTLLDWSKQHQVGLLVTNDVHYVTAADARAHDMLLCVQTSSLLKQEKRMRLTDPGYYLKSLAEMEAAFRPLADLPQSAFTNSLKIAEMCAVNLEDNTYHLPDLPNKADIFARYGSYAGYLRHLTEEGVTTRYGDRATSPDVQARKEHELKIISQMGFDVYYLIVWDLCNFARRENIWWNVRGSGAGSIVAYAIGITLIDPLKNNLIFERFLNPGRVSMPDFDLDYPDDQRNRMIEYARATYGDERVAQIVSFGRMKARAAIRDVGRALDMPLAAVDRLAKQISAIPGKPATIANSLDPEHEFFAPELKEQLKTDKATQELVEFARSLEGIARHSSIHAAAVIISDNPLTNYVPLMRPPSDTVITKAVTQFEFPVCESIGLLKVDFLGLSTLTVMRKAAELIKARHGVEYTLDNVPYETQDKPTFDLIARGDVTGVFQVEGAGMRRMLTEMRPSRFEHLVAAISLYRPGPMEYIPTYIKRMHGQEPIAYKHPLLEPILAETYGICVSGDAMVADTRTGRRLRLDEVQNFPELVIQGVDENWQPAAGRVVRWIDSGHKPVYRLTLRNGASIKVTADHRLLTEAGWQPLADLKCGDYVATPPYLLGPEQVNTTSVDRLNWQKILSIEPAGIEHVYDLTVEGLHSFVANNIIVHNCVYQEQLIQIATDLAGYTPGEADLMRRAVGKKKKEELLKHRDKFIAGAAERGIPAETAGAIFDDIEFFARYGFNKSHAADYAMVTCQTAYLKAHYPLEYMAALLSVERNNTDKVSGLVAECRAMNINVAPPCLNQSATDFVIEEKPGAAATIRFGLSAIKNVGESAVETIIAARNEGGPFADVDDFCRRVNLQLVNRRVLESLIKVGAMDCFGQPRPLLLAVIDRMLNLSGSIHKAAAVGQFSMFDLGGFEAPQTGSILHPPPEEVEAVSNKEMQAWEKELVGIYLSDHHTQHLTSLQIPNRTPLAALTEMGPGKPVTVAGMITTIRRIQTKKGDPMAFVQLEDETGSGEVVLFPRTYAAGQALLVEDTIIVVRGKLDDQEGRGPKVLADTISTEVISYGEAVTPHPLGEGIGSGLPSPSGRGAGDRRKDGLFVEEPLPIEPRTNGSQPAKNGPASPPPMQGAMPLPPAPATLEAGPLPLSPAEEPAPPPPVGMRPGLHITLPRTGDLVQDKHRLAQMIDLLLQEPGQDRFCLYIPNGEGKVQIDFPNHTTRYTPQLKEKLARFFAAEVVWVHVKESVPPAVAR